jgi:hypothetical protein
MALFFQSEQREVSLFGTASAKTVHSKQKRDSSEESEPGEEIAFVVFLTVFFAHHFLLTTEVELPARLPLIRTSAITSRGLGGDPSPMQMLRFQREGVSSEKLSHKRSLWVAASAATFNRMKNHGL